MTDALSGIITQLGKQKAAIERALAALREVDGLSVGGDGGPPLTSTAPARKRRKFSAATRRKMALAQQARRVKGEIEATQVRTPEPVEAKRRISAEGMKRIIAATKKRWRLKRAAAKAAPANKGVAKKAAVKKAAVKKAIVKNAVVKKAVVKKAAAKKATAKVPTAKAVKKVSPVRKAVEKKPTPEPAQAASPAVAQTAD